MLARFHRRRQTVATSTLLLFAALTAGACAARLHAQSAEPPGHATSTPYSGDLSIFEYKDRDQKLQIQHVFDLLGMHPGTSIADIGAGSGWLTVRAAARVAPGGTVFAEDINPVAIHAITDRASREKLPNITAVLGAADDPMLPPKSVDVVVMLKVYHEIAHTELLLQHLKPALRPGARIGIIDRNGDGSDHGLNEDIVVKEMRAAGFHRVGRYDFTKADGQDYFLIFKQDGQ
ncbi:class I SAM-dependent methyltransferase [Acidipila sp. EB88]|uniref:class I SAM-dependent methyltransferase n=1 Tax=Acidipila sp. EB88 TaxID=2305226 RepID=UPI001F3F91EE|nr:class I SAM-dependent methyltransferase [Acidipila sp. EB88]